MRVLITNDDGILAPGLAALIRAAEWIGELDIVAPEIAQSAAAHSITFTEPLICQQVQLPEGPTGYSVAGRPADCVKLALTELLTETPDLVISGINAGANVGVNVLYSGTVAAAVEAAFFNLPAVAVSLAIADKVDFDYARDNARNVLKLLLDHDVLTPGRVLNVNIPAYETGGPKGIKIVPQSTRGWADRYERRRDPRGRLYFWLATEPVNSVGFHEQTDEKAIDDGYVTITPLKMDLTNTELLETLRSSLADKTW